MSTLPLSKSMEFSELGSITGSNLQRVLDELKPGDELSFVKKSGGELAARISFASKTRSSIQLRAIFEARLNPLPVTAGWASRMEEPSDGDRARSKEHKKEINIGAKKNQDEKNQFKFTVVMWLKCGDPSEPSRTSLSGVNRLMYQFSDNIVVYTTLDGDPVAYTENQQMKFF